MALPIILANASRLALIGARAAAPVVLPGLRYGATAAVALFTIKSGVVVADRAHNKIFGTMSKREAKAVQAAETFKACLDVAESDNERLSREAAALRGDLEYSSWKDNAPSSRPAQAPLKAA